MSSDPRTKVSARAIVIVEIEVDVHSQAVDEARGRIDNLLQDAVKRDPVRGRGISLHGVPKVTAVIHQREIP